MYYVNGGAVFLVFTAPKATSVAFLERDRLPAAALFLLPKIDKIAKRYQDIFDNINLSDICEQIVN